MMIRLKRFFTIMVCIVMLSFLSSCFGAPLVEEKGGIKPPEEEKVEEAQKELSNINLQELSPIKEEVHQLHLIMNNLTGWGQLGKYKDKSGSGWETVASYLAGENSIVDRVYDIIAKIDSETLKQDLEAFALAFEKAYEKKDIDLLLLAHRIVHDLDYWVFNYKTVSGGSRNYWGVTVTLEGDKASAKEVLNLK
ncbi:hypothetical protein KVG29_08500 [Caldicoprobacter algeriensis]|uniref:hypothetical protein n=1 Tax=Caldicoprobacter algeriensis TaxID=699281 RepID=UPI0020797157|nr:hypothetical protein [Caldicoprobacter algeriensis]MCM8901260.1 hypothetical protein [Caldicoprobacter algeriensis]